MRRPVNGSGVFKFLGPGSGAPLPPANCTSTREAALTGEAQTVRIVRDDGVEDELTRLYFSSYDEAYDELERFYGDLCCSDERVEYSIVSQAGARGVGASSNPL